MRPILTAIMAIAWLAAGALPGLAQTSAYTTADVNMREGPGTSYRVIVVVPEGSAVVINDCVSNRRWCDVTWQSYRGYVYDRYLSTYSEGYAPGYSLPEPAPPAVIFEYYNYGDRDYRPYYRYHSRDRFDRLRRLHRDRDKRRKYDRRHNERKYDRSGDRKRRDTRKTRQRRDGKTLDRNSQRRSGKRRDTRQRSQSDGRKRSRDGTSRKRSRDTRRTRDRDSKTPRSRTP